VPIKVGDITYGALSVDRVFSNEISLEEDVRFLSILASILPRQ
jgi:Nif-specific regulatory protein